LRHAFGCPLCRDLAAKTVSARLRTLLSTGNTPEWSFLTEGALKVHTLLGVLNGRKLALQSDQPTRELELSYVVLVDAKSAWAELVALIHSALIGARLRANVSYG
tara:strand:- start:152920 stop:153234 length:315 start_codon:yes stop_codon:yes gene_type:complete